LINPVQIDRINTIYKINSKTKHIMEFPGLFLLIV